jgi:hypothetical protein
VKIKIVFIDRFQDESPTMVIFNAFSMQYWIYTRLRWSEGTVVIFRVEVGVVTFLHEHVCVCVRVYVYVRMGNKVLSKQ